MARIHGLSLALLFLSLQFAPATLSQEAPDTSSAPARDPRVGVLAGHEFIPSSFIDDPFVRTFLRTGLGFGSTINFVPPPVIVHGKPIKGPTGDLMFAVLDFEFQYAIRSWLGVRGRLDVTGRMADETSTLVTRGVTLFSGFELGWVFKAAESERAILSGSVGVKNSSITDVYLQRFLEGIIESGEILPGNNLVVTTPTLRGTVGVRAAYMVTRLTGVTINGNVDYGESMTRGEADQWYYSLSAAFDFNLHSQSGVPLGFVLGGSTSSAADVAGVDGRTAQTVFGRISYTGAEQFSLGLDMAYNYIPIRGLEEKQNFLSAVVDIRLFF